MSQSRRELLKGVLGVGALAAVPAAKAASGDATAAELARLQLVTGKRVKGGLKALAEEEVLPDVLAPGLRAGLDAGWWSCINVERHTGSLKALWRKALDDAGLSDFEVVSTEEMHRRAAARALPAMVDRLVTPQYTWDVHEASFKGRGAGDGSDLVPAEMPAAGLAALTSHRWARGGLDDVLASVPALLVAMAAELARKAEQARASLGDEAGGKVRTVVVDVPTPSLQFRGFLGEFFLYVHVSCCYHEPGLVPSHPRPGGTDV